MSYCVKMFTVARLLNLTLIPACQRDRGEQRTIKCGSFLNVKAEWGKCYFYLMSNCSHCSRQREGCRKKAVMVANLERGLASFVVVHFEALLCARLLCGCFHHGNG